VSAEAETVGGLAAVERVAARLGLRPTSLRVLATGWGLVIALEPLPAVARVCLVAADERRTVPQAVQVRLAAYAAARGAPVVSPLSDVDPGPHVEGRFVVTLWERVPAEAPDPAAAGRALRALHETIAAYPGPLPPYDPRPSARRIAAELPASAHETAAVLRAACVAYTPPDLPGQPLHGDAHLGNALGGGLGPLWNDFEYACHGPVEWDLASAAHRATVFGELVDETRAFLAAYGADAVHRADVMSAAFGLHAAAQTASALVSRPALHAQARRRLDWVRSRLAL